MITPTIGRVVWYYTSDGKGPFAAIVAHVHSDRMVNLAVFNESGVSRSETSVLLVQPEDENPPRSNYCCWMPYQVKKGHGSESGEKAAGTEAV